MGHFDKQYQNGADPVALFEDLLEITHFLTRIKVLPIVTSTPGVPEIERTQGNAMALKLSMASLARTWQILLKGLGEVRMAPSQKQAAEMVLVRLAYTANMPTPDEAISKLSDGKSFVSTSTHTPPVSTPNLPDRMVKAVNIVGEMQTQTAPQQAPQPETLTEPEALARPLLETFEDVLTLADEMREGMLRTHLISDVRLVHFEQGRIEFSPSAQAPRDLAQLLSAFLKKYSGQRWIVSVSSKQGGNTISEQRETTLKVLRAEVSEEPLIKAVLETFPGTILDEIIKENVRLPEMLKKTNDDNLD